MTVPWAVSKQWEESRSGDDGGASQRIKTKKKYDAIDDDCNNFVVFKFKEPAVVVWAPPECVEQFPSPGDTLFVMMLTDGSRKLHLVQVPSFDMRFKFESQWRVKKTLTSRYRTLEREIQAEAKKRTEREAKKDGGEAEEEKPDSSDQEMFAGVSLVRVRSSLFPCCTCGPGCGRCIGVEEEGRDGGVGEVMERRRMGRREGG